MRIEDLYAEMGDALKTGREAAGFTQNELAQMVGLSRASIANIETGRQKVFLHQLFIFAGHLNLDVTDLLPKHGSVDDSLPKNLSDEQKYWAESVLTTALSNEKNSSLIAEADLNEKNQGLIKLTG